MDRYRFTFRHIFPFSYRFAIWNFILALGNVEPLIYTYFETIIAKKTYPEWHMFWRWKVVSLRENVSLRVCQRYYVTYPECNMSPKIVSLRGTLMQFFPKWHTSAQTCVFKGKVVLNFPKWHNFASKKCVTKGKF